MSGKPVCVADFEEYAKKFLPKSVYDYYRSGAGDQETLADNVAAFARWKLYPRVLRDVSVMDLSTSVLGQKISMPVCVAATAMQRMAHADGETATAKALGQWIHWWIQGRMATVGQFGCHALGMPLRGKRWEFAHLEKNSKFPFPYKVTLTKYASFNWALLPCPCLKYVASGLPTGTESIPFPNRLMKRCPVGGGKETLKFQVEKRAKKMLSVCSPVDFSSGSCSMVYLDLLLCGILQLRSPRMKKAPFYQGVCSLVGRYVLAGGSPGLSTVGLRNLRLLKAAVEHHIPILALFGPEIKGSTNNSKLYHPDIENFPSLLCVAHAMRSGLPFTSTGACSVYKACRAMGTGMMLSSWATSSIEEVAEAAPAGLLWLQLYVYKDREVTKSLVKRAERAGYKGIFVTVDTPFLGRRIDDVRKFQLPPHLRLKNFSSNDLAFSSGKDFGENSGLAVYVAEAIDASVNWEDIKWLRGLTSLPIVVKGILRADDAKEAVKIGVNGILVSNHGARQLDGVPATIDVLPEIVEAVEGKVEVFLDGGVRKGTDILKALALGAKAVFIGRPLIWGLVYQGEEGAKEVLQMLKEEFRLAMALTGCRRVEEIGRTLIRRHQVLFSKI